MHQQAIARSEQACFFLSWPQGVFAYTERAGANQISVAIRSVFMENLITADALDNVWLGWMNRRLWVSIPYAPGGTATDANRAFVLDPEVGEGAWMMFTDAAGDGTRSLHRTTGRDQ